MSARETPLQEYTGWGCTQATPTVWDLWPGFPSCQAPSSTENWEGLCRLLEERGSVGVSQGPPGGQEGLGGSVWAQAPI